MNHFSTFAICGTVKDVRVKTFDGGGSIRTIVLHYGDHAKRDGSVTQLIAAVEVSDRVRAPEVVVGDEVLVGGEGTARQWQDKYYPRLTANSMTVTQRAQGYQPQQMQQPQPMPQQPPAYQQQQYQQPQQYAQAQYQAPANFSQPAQPQPESVQGIIQGMSEAFDTVQNHKPEVFDEDIPF